jgi:hypothetical protein
VIDEFCGLPKDSGAKSTSAFNSHKRKDFFIFTKKKFSQKQYLGATSPWETFYSKKQLMVAE